MWHCIVRFFSLAGVCVEAVQAFEADSAGCDLNYLQ